MGARMELLKSLAQKGTSKMVLLVMDGLGGLPSENGQTELERAYTPNIDEIAAQSECGLLEMVDLGITPGSGPGHLGLFGYDPLEFQIGRGILEALGVGAEVKSGEVCARGNFATWTAEGVIADRRAGRISSEKNRQIIDRLRNEISEIDGVRVRFYPGEEHRFVVVLSGEGLSEAVTDADPQKEGLPMKWASPSGPGGEKTAEAVNALVRRVRQVLSDEPAANGCLLRGFSGAPVIPCLSELYKINPAAIATYPMYRGLARLVGMEVLDAGRTMEDLFSTLEAHWDAHDFFFVHVKYTDSRGEDGDFKAKREVIEKVDRLIPRLTDLHPDVLVITGDHSTPSQMKGHSWHPVPFLLQSAWCRPDEVLAFGERMVARGIHGRIPASSLMGLMLAHGLRLAKFGA